MTSQFFNDQIQRLSSTFGKSGFSDERVKLIWDVCAKLSDFEFKQIVNQMLATSRYAPLPEDFKTAAYGETKNRAHLKLVSNCKQCEGVGFFEAMCIKIYHPEMEIGRHYTFMCDCAHAPRSHSNWLPHYGEYYMPTWQRGWSKKYNELVIGKSQNGPEGAA